LNPQNVQVTLNLPATIASAMQQSSQQPIDQQIMALLKQAVNSQQALNLQELNPPQAAISQNLPSDFALRQEIEQLKQRLSLVEALLSRVEAIEGKIDHLVAETASLRSGSDRAIPPQTTSDSLQSQMQIIAGQTIPGQAIPGQTIAATEPQPAAMLPVVDKAQDKDSNPGSAVASIWLQVQQNDRPPDSIPSTLKPESCPICQQRLMPFKSSGRVVCIQCGWTDKPRTPASSAAPVDAPDLQKLLEQAATESLENMKPRKRST
jgi:hypothetical protein